jgi:pyruvate dehydrogenase E2 component (dihydrolipoamide acetyltransferase)
MQELKLPSLGADMDDATLIEWKIKPGESVKRGDVVAIVDTSKAAIDIESWQEGTVLQLLVQPGDKFVVGTVMATMSGGDATMTTPAPKAAPAAAILPAIVPATRVVATTAEPAQPATRARISPAARKRAAELGLDLASLTGSGPQGSVTLQDVEAAAVVPVSASRDRGAAMRATIAAAMARSKREIPHYYLGESIVLGNATKWLQAWNAARPVTERILMSALLLKAVARALQKYPQLNGYWRDGKFEAVAEVHAGVAIALRSGGLIAPALLNVDQRPLPDLMQGLNDLVKRARAGSLRSSELSSATITVTNLGEQSVESVFGVIYPPQVALVGFGGVREQVVAEQGEMKILPVVHASLAADHRASDGQLGARFLRQLAVLLQDPQALACKEDA